MSHYFVDDGWINDGLQIHPICIVCFLLTSAQIYLSNVEPNNFTSNATVDIKDF